MTGRLRHTGTVTLGRGRGGSGRNVRVFYASSSELWESWREAMSLDSRNIAMERQAGSHDESFRRIRGDAN